MRDHFHLPYIRTHVWDEFHGMWPAEIVRTLNTVLPPGFRSGPRVFLSSGFEVDVGAMDYDRNDAPSDDGGGTATLVAPAPTYTIDADLVDEDEYEVQVYDTREGRTLVATIELVSPSNKDRPLNREKFVDKCLALLHRDVCVSIVDVVTVRHANLYQEILERLDRSDPDVADVDPMIDAVTLRGRRPDERRTRLDAWYYPMRIGEPLPTLPIWLTEDSRVLLPLETSYEEARRVLAVP